MPKSVFGVIRTGTETRKGGDRGEGAEKKTEVEERDSSGGAEQSFQPATELSFMGSWT